MLRRIIGLIMLILGLVGLVISTAGVYAGRRAIDAAGGGLDSTLALTSQTLNTAVESLELAKATIGDVNEGLDTVGLTTISVARTITETRPLITHVAEVAGEDAPASIEAMQRAIPNMAAVAGSIDTTLRTLNEFRIEESFLGQSFSYDLGINYSPAAPFDDTVEDMGNSLDGLPDRLRSMKDDLEVSSANLQTIGDSIVLISQDLTTINGRVADVAPLLDQYIDIVRQIDGSILNIRTQVTQQMALVKNVLTFVLVWWGLPQLALVLIGWDFFVGRRGLTKEALKQEILAELRHEPEPVEEAEVELAAAD